MVTHAEALVAGADPIVPERFRVSAKRQETMDTWTLELEALDSEHGLEFSPGQFNMVYAFGAGEVPISISGDPSQPSPLVHTVRAVGAATQAVCRTEVDEVVGIRGPFGSGWPVAEAEQRDAVVVAGGVGLAPLRSAVYELLRRRERFRRVVLLYGGRSPDQLLYEQEVRAWINDEALDVLVTVDTASRGWFGRVGVVPKLIDGLDLEPEQAVAFLCGPEVMMELSARALMDRGMRSSDVYLSMERNMKCAVGHCGHCQFGPTFVCRDGPVFSYATVDAWMRIREV